MGRKKGISTHRKSSKRKNYTKHCNCSISVVSNNDNVANSVSNKVLIPTNRTPISSEDISGNHPLLLHNTNASIVDSPCSRLMNTNLKGRCIMPLLDDANNRCTLVTKQNSAKASDDVPFSNENKLRTLKKGNNDTESFSYINVDKDFFPLTAKAKNSSKDNNNCEKGRTIIRGVPKYRSTTLFIAKMIPLPKTNLLRFLVPILLRIKCSLPITL